MTVVSEALEADAFTKFKLLMWKNFLQQWRHRVQTLIELLLPFITMTLVLILRWQIEPSNQGPLAYPPIPAHSLNYSSRVLVGMNITELSIAYSPRSPELEDVITSALTNMLGQNALDLLPVIIEMFPEIELPPDINLHPQIVEIIKRLISFRVQAYNSSNELRGVYVLEETTRKVLAVVEFDDDLFGATALPDQMTYALRFPERPRMSSFYHLGGRSWRSDLVYPAFEVPGPRNPFSWEGGNDPGYVNEMFIALQHSISTEIISRITGENLTEFDVNIQRYPHPSYVQDVAVEALQFLLPTFLLLTYTYTAVNIVRAITVEKEHQLKETMKIMGMPTWLHWTAWFCKQFVYLFISSVFIVVLLKVNWFTNSEGFSSYAVFTNTPWTVLLFYLNLYLICTITFCFMISGIFSSASTASLFTGVIWFFSGIPAFLLTMDDEVGVTLQTFTCFSINSAMAYGFQFLLAAESTGGLQWGEFFLAPSTESSRFTFGHVVLMLVVDVVLYMLIALYLEQVLPGPFGTPRPWNFLFSADFWSSTPNKYKGDLLAGDGDIDDNVLKEKDPTGHVVGVNISNLTKVYGANIAVNQLTLKIYDDQITVLLGHNGAGKSTTISMLTGNLQPTNGSVIVAGYDISRQTRAARAHLGLCPQHNVLFSELTVREHLEFFARLKGFKGQELKDDIDSLIKKLELDEKSDYPSAGLSGGQKRRLCVGIALSGGARVVLLDEPTSGMDPASRRALWDLLQREKKGRSMILTTHFMDEADFLGDRIAIMAHGRLQCVGSPQFLKHNHGVGYQLVVVKDSGFDYHACLDLISKYIPGITVKDDRGLEITFSLLNDHAHLFETMLADFESRVDTIRFKNYGLIATTLEDVFMSLGADLAPVNSVSDDVTLSSEADSLDQLQSISDIPEQEVTGIRLLWQHVSAIWFKLWLVWSRSWGMVLMQLAVPVVLINTSLFVSQFVLSFTSTIVPRNLTLTDGFSQTETLLAFDGASLSSMGAHASLAYERIFANSGIDTMRLTLVDNQTIDQYYMERASNPTAMGAMRHSVLIGATFTENSATAWFSNFGYHDVANSLAAVHSALLKARKSMAHLHVYNHPLEATYNNQNDMVQMVTLLSIQLANGIGSSIGIVSAVFIMFYIREKTSGAKLLQKAAGLQPAVMWFSAAVFDWLWFIAIALTIPLSCFAFDIMGLSTFLELGRMYLCILVYGAAMLPFNYLLSHMFKGPAIGFVVVFFANVLLGILGPQIVDALSAPMVDAAEAARIIDMILQFYPMYSFITAVRTLNQVEMTIQSCLRACDFMTTVLPNMEECNMQLMCDMYGASCCVREDAYFEWEKPGILRYLVMMLLSCVVLWVLLMVIEYRLLNRIFTRKRTPPPVDASALDADVAEEAAHVTSISQSGLRQHGLVARGLTKYYGPHLAVDQVSFSVSDSECFGLLGVNGAGKTTTFKMLMGDESISGGAAFVGGHSVENNLTSVHKNIGYCPQFDALFNELTGRETIRLFSQLRGMHRRSTDLHTNTLATALGFFKHLDKKVSEYSGGTKRKLNTAVAFLGNTRLVFVDEPTTGVDPAAKRHVWRAVRSVQKAGRGVVLTSHSMEECEALCSRLTIMVNGRFQCLGTPQHLKNKFSEGYTLTIKLKLDDHAQNSTASSVTEDVKAFVQTNFAEPKIMEEYQGVITYYLSDRSVPWSRMFGIMERAKRDHAVEYYSISQTTLEQIFLQFTKYQREQSA